MTIIKIKIFVCLGYTHNLEQQHPTSANYFKRLWHMCWGLLSFLFREAYAPWTKNSWCSKNTAFRVLMYFFTGLPGNLYLWLNFVKWQYGWEQVSSLLRSEQINQDLHPLTTHSFKMLSMVTHYGSESSISFTCYPSATWYNGRPRHQKESNFTIAFLVNWELVVNSFNKSLKDYSKPMKQLHGKRKNPLINLKKKGKSLSATLPQALTARGKKSLLQCLLKPWMFSFLSWFIFLA